MADLIALLRECRAALDSIGHRGAKDGCPTCATKNSIDAAIAELERADNGLHHYPDVKRLRSGFTSSAISDRQQPVYSEYVMKGDYDELRTRAVALAARVRELEGNGDGLPKDPYAALAARVREMEKERDNG